MKTSSHHEKKDKGVFFKAREDMVKEQIISRGIKDPQVLKAMKKVHRELFVPAEYTGSAYEDRPLPIGMGQTISQPYIVALMTESLELDKSMSVLEIGTGSGYQTAILAEITSKVYSVEIKEDLCGKNKLLLGDYNNIKLSCHDGSKGWEKYAPYDRILVTAAPQDVPWRLLEQLRDGGIMVIPVGASTWSQELLKVIKTKERIKKIKICDVAFVPLTGNPG
jgi:protein-L-isoaspartate(D-aspartate) O-methyltransferase